MSKSHTHIYSSKREMQMPNKYMNNARSMSHQERADQYYMETLHPNELGFTKIKTVNAGEIVEEKRTLVH